MNRAAKHMGEVRPDTSPFRNGERRPQENPPEAAYRRNEWEPGWLSWCQFLELPGLTKAIANNVYYATDGEGWFSRATVKFLQRHGVRGVYAPGACPS